MCNAYYAFSQVIFGEHKMPVLPLILPIGQLIAIDITVRFDGEHTTRSSTNFPWLTS